MWSRVALRCSLALLAIVALGINGAVADDLDSMADDTVPLAPREPSVRIIDDASGLRIVAVLHPGKPINVDHYGQRVFLVSENHYISIKKQEYSLDRDVGSGSDSDKLLLVIRASMQLPLEKFHAEVKLTHDRRGSLVTLKSEAFMVPPRIAIVGKIAGDDDMANILQLRDYVLEKYTSSDVTIEIFLRRYYSEHLINSKFEKDFKRKANSGNVRLFDSSVPDISKLHRLGNCHLILALTPISVHFSSYLREDSDRAIKSSIAARAIEVDNMKEFLGKNSENPNGIIVPEISGFDAVPFSDPSYREIFGRYLSNLYYTSMKSDRQCLFLATVLRFDGSSDIHIVADNNIFDKFYCKYIEQKYSVKIKTDFTYSADKLLAKLGKSSSDNSGFKRTMTIHVLDGTDGQKTYSDHYKAIAASNSLVGVDTFNELLLVLSAGKIPIYIQSTWDSSDYRALSTAWRNIVTHGVGETSPLLHLVFAGDKDLQTIETADSEAELETALNDVGKIKEVWASVANPDKFLLSKIAEAIYTVPKRTFMQRLKYHWRKFDLFGRIKRMLKRIC